MDKYEYEQTYGERIIHCPIHNIYGVDGCVACDEEQQEIIIEMTTKCVTCGYASSEDEFINVSRQLPYHLLRKGLLGIWKHKT